MRECEPESKREQDGDTYRKQPERDLIAPERADDARLIATLRPLLGAIDVDAMRAANYSVDREDNKQTPAAAARELARELGL